MSGARASVGAAVVFGVLLVGAGAAGGRGGTEAVSGCELPQGAERVRFAQRTSRRGSTTPSRLAWCAMSMTRDLSPLDPKVLEYKFYARGIGPVLAVGVSGGDDREELVRDARGRSR